MNLMISYLLFYNLILYLIDHVRLLFCDVPVEPPFASGMQFLLARMQGTSFYFHLVSYAVYVPVDRVWDGCWNA